MPTSALDEVDLMGYDMLEELTHASKILLKVLLKRLEAKVKAVNYLGKDQLRFIKGTGTTLRNLGERALEHRNDLNVSFVDYEKAFNRLTE